MSPQNVARASRPCLDASKTYDIDANSIAALIPFSGHTITHFTDLLKQTQRQLEAGAPMSRERDKAQQPA